MSDLGDRVRARRKELKLTIRELAKRCGLSPSVLCDVERGKRSVGADTLVSLGGVLGMPLDQLMKGDGVRTCGPVVQFPASLTAFASAGDVPFRRVTCLFWMQKTIMDHRTSERRVDLEAVDWTAFHEAVKDFL